MNVWRRSIRTAKGEFVAAFSAHGLVALEFPSRSPRPDKTRSNPPGAKPPTALRHWLRTTARAVKRVLAGHKPDRLPPLDLSRGTGFQRAVWRALTEIERGETRTYSDVARRVGSPRAARVVGQACRVNPLPVLIPCHRVLAMGGKLGGFSGGIEWKRLLLERERVKLARPNPRRPTCSNLPRTAKQRTPESSVNSED